MWQEVSKSFSKHTFGYIIIYIYILGTNISETTISETTIIEKLPQPKEMLSQKRVSGNNIYRF